ncbi:MAG: RAMP superfamily CRISPR-associated protein [Oscillochloridaceae bacterium]|nr:RAMP superfamily CRISPR-associated protein [Chloroflexaceae bacterium]MCX7790593.1 RAMP superfamily CRISPR-associated protein [Chloroflexaceae bacterium]MDW8388670.1 RAMP superfamily CRISPR-associated protein [Oscillochloridaceae bacterium]
MTNRDRGRGPQQPPLPKPYDFVPLPAGKPQRQPPAGHHRYQPGALSGTLQAVIVARSPVHVASGILEQVPGDRQYPLVKGHFRTGGVPAIPATSLKGCVRSIVEAISRSAVQVTRAQALPNDYRPPRSAEELDVAQRIFGALGYQGLARFADAPLREGKVITVPTPQLFRPRPEAMDAYFDGRTPRGRKFYMHGKLAKGNLPLEACDVGSRFDLRLDFSNLTPGELGLILIALGLGEPRLWPKLGGGKPACLGTIEVLEPRLTRDDPQARYADFDAGAAPLDVAPLIAAAREEGLALEPQLKRLAETLRWPREDRECPDRSY